MNNTPKYSKLSRLRRKELNAMRNMGDVPWPGRPFQIPPTAASLATNKRCTHVLQNRNRRRNGWRGIIDRVLRRQPLVERLVCNQPLELIPASHSQPRRIVCPSCDARRREMRSAMRQMFGPPPRLRGRRS